MGTPALKKARKLALAHRKKRLSLAGRSFKGRANQVRIKIQAAIDLIESTVDDIEDPSTMDAFEMVSDMLSKAQAKLRRVK